MRISLIDLDSLIPNLALMKLSKFYKDKGHVVGINLNDPDKVFISCIYPKNKYQALGQKRFFKVPVEIGGPGYDYDIKLPNEIEFYPPDYSLYKVCSNCGHVWLGGKARNCYCKNNEKVDMFYSMGFTSRGCPRKCSFCIVHDKEGDIQGWDNLNNFHYNGFDTIMLLDNNLLACEWPVCGSYIGSPKQEFWEYVLDYFISNNLKLWEMGLDIRYITKEKAEMLAKVKPYKQWHFAFDNWNTKIEFIKGMNILLDAGISPHRIMVYVLAFYNSGIGDAIRRIDIIDNFKADAWLMPYEIKTEDQKNFYRWVNNKAVHYARTWDQYKEDVKKSNWSK